VTTSTVPQSVESPLVARRARVSRFLRVLIGITVGIHLPVALGVAQLARRLGWPSPALIGWGWALLGVSLFAGRVRATVPDRRGRNAAIVRFFDIPYFVHWCAAVFTLIPAVVATLVSPIIDLVQGRPVGLPVDAYMVSYLLGLVVCAYGVLVRRRWVRVVEREVTIPGLDARLEGMRIAHLSDLHIGTMTPLSWGLAWARSANGRSPDVTVVTGDMVTSGTDFHGDVAEVIGALRSPGGVFASMGNHDYFGEGEPLISLLRARGVTVLRNEGVVIERGGARVWMAAIDDTWTRRDDTAILLAHDPGRFDAAAAAGADLVLSGHTHGGQVAMPFLTRWNLASFGYPYNVGIYRRDRSVLYVHPGLGTTGPPIRIGAAPEVTILVLKGAKAS
jgi:uncharacterized protein